MDSDNSLREYMNGWLYTYKSCELKPASFDRLERTIESNILPVLGEEAWNTITSDDIRLFLNSLITRGYSYSVIKKSYDALKACYHFSMIREDIDKNPMLSINPPSKNIKPPKEIRILSRNEINLLKEEINRRDGMGNYIWPYGHAYILMLNIGVRSGEMIGLNWNDIDWDKRISKIRKNVVTKRIRGNNFQPKSGYETIIQYSLKTSKSRRNLYLNDNALETLMILKENNAFNMCDSIIQNRFGNVVSPQQFYRTFQNILKNAGVVGAGLHVLRHTFASMLFEKGCDIKIVSELLGHSSVKITYDTYIHLIEEQPTDALKLLDVI